MDIISKNLRKASKPKRVAASFGSSKRRKGCSPGFRSWIGKVTTTTLAHYRYLIRLIVRCVGMVQAPFKPTLYGGKILFLTTARPLPVQKSDVGHIKYLTVSAETKSRKCCRCWTIIHGATHMKIGGFTMSCDEKRFRDGSIFQVLEPGIGTTVSYFYDLLTYVRYYIMRD